MNEPMQSGDAGGRPAIGHEPSDLEPRNIALFGAALTVVIVAALALSYGLFTYGVARHAKQQVPPSPLTYAREPTPEPRLQVNGPKELEEMRAAENEVLNSYGWIDKEAGIVRIPVDRAIETLAKKGLPVRQEGGTPATKSQERRNK